MGPEQAGAQIESLGGEGAPWFPIPELPGVGGSPAPCSPGDRSPVCDIPPPSTSQERKREVALNSSVFRTNKFNQYGTLGCLPVLGSHINCPPGDEGAVQLGLHVVLECRGRRQHEAFLCLFVLFVLLVLALWPQGTRGTWRPEDGTPIPKHLSFRIVGPSSAAGSSSWALPPSLHPQQDESQGPPSQKQQQQQYAPTSPPHHWTHISGRGPGGV